MDFSDLTVLCFGDIMLDRYLYGDMQRISPEAPVPILCKTHTREMLGGVGNVVNNIVALGGKARLVGVIGQDRAATLLKRLLKNHTDIDSYLFDSSARNTTIKSRYIASNQQIIRVDEESRLPLNNEEFQALRASLSQQVKESNAVIISDYGKGMCSKDLVAELIQRARECGIPVFVDPKGADYSQYKGASCLTPNLKELALAVGLTELDNSEDVILLHAQKLLQMSECEALLVTRSEKGMSLITREGIRSVFSSAREVFDVSGAGDTVIASLTLAYLSGLSLDQAMYIANSAAGVVVGKFGTAVAGIEEVTAELEKQYDKEIDPAIFPLSIDSIQQLVTRWKLRGLTVGFTNGCFDILHPGHIHLLRQARRSCDKLIVALNSDNSIRRLKGTKRPVNPLSTRAEVLACLRPVDAVVAFDEDTPRDLITLISPDILFKGADYNLDQVVGSDWVCDRGGKVVLIPVLSAYSTTQIIAQICGQNDKRK